MVKDIEFYGGPLDGKIMPLEETLNNFIVGNENGEPEYIYVRFCGENRMIWVTNFYKGQIKNG